MLDPYKEYLRRRKKSVTDNHDFEKCRYHDPRTESGCSNKAITNAEGKQTAYCAKHQGYMPSGGIDIGSLTVPTSSGRKIASFSGSEGRGRQ